MATLVVSPSAALRLHKLPEWRESRDPVVDGYFGAATVVVERRWSDFANRRNIERVVVDGHETTVEKLLNGG